jgi:hypothetical protein
MIWPLFWGNLNNLKKTGEPMNKFIFVFAAMNLSSIAFADTATCTGTTSARVAYTVTVTADANGGTATIVDAASQSVGQYSQVVIQALSEIEEQFGTEANDPQPFQLLVQEGQGSLSATLDNGLTVTLDGMTCQ